MVVETSGRTSVPNSKLSTPPVWAIFQVTYIDDGQIKKEHGKTKQTRYVEFVYLSGKYELRVCFASPFYEDDIHPEIHECPRVYDISDMI